MLNNQIVFALVCFTLGMIAMTDIAEIWQKWSYSRKAAKGHKTTFDEWQFQEKEKAPDEPIPPQRDAEAEIPPDYQAEDDFKYPEGEEPEDKAEREKKEGTRGFFS